MGRLGWESNFCKSRGRRYFANGSCTRVHVKKRLRFDPAGLFRDLDRIGFPFAYLEGLDIVRFTVMPGDNRGLYFDGKIWIDVSYAGIDEVLETFVHEVAHHLDDNWEISELLTEERKRGGGKRLKNRQARGSDDEYLAVGFERYYSLDPKKRALLRRQCPRLYRTIAKLHRAYSRLGR